MQYREVTPLPEICQNCKEVDCYNCDRAGERWLLSNADILKSRREMLMKAIERLQRQVRKIDEELAQNK